jgi:hypothetical protein
MMLELLGVLLAALLFLLAGWPHAAAACVAVALIVAVMA